MVKFVLLVLDSVCFHFEIGNHWDFRQKVFGNIGDLTSWTLIDLKTQSGLANNAAVLTRNRFLMANIGNEDGACRDDVFTGRG